MPSLDIDEAFRRLRRAVRLYPKAALFELRDAGHGSGFEQLVACLISTRTRDETSLPVARRLFEQARTPAAMVELGVAGVQKLIAGCAFSHTKSVQIVEIARRVKAHPELLREEAGLRTLPGVGPKCAHLVLGVAEGQPFIGVDVHVHRVTNRWGYVAAATPEKTEAQLRQKLPRRYWIEINERLVPFGKHICTGLHPRCLECPLLSMCERVGLPPLTAVAQAGSRGEARAARRR